MAPLTASGAEFRRCDIVTEGTTANRRIVILQIGHAAAGKKSFGHASKQQSRNSRGDGCGALTLTHTQACRRALFISLNVNPHHPKTLLGFGDDCLSYGCFLGPRLRKRLTAACHQSQAPRPKANIQFISIQSFIYGCNYKWVLAVCHCVFACLPRVKECHQANGGEQIKGRQCRAAPPC